VGTVTVAARGIFLTGTDTGAGKTLVSCAILSALRRRGLRVAAYKPVETGCRLVDGVRVGDDCERLAAATGRCAADVAAYLFTEPAAPLVAAEAENAIIDRRVLIERYAAVARDADFVLVESAGGLMVPVAEGYTTKDLAIELGLPVVCVVASRLGCINHTLLTVQVLRNAAVSIAGFVINEIDPDDEHRLASRTNRDVIGRFAEVPDLGAFPHVELARRGDPEFLAALAETHVALDALVAGSGN